jgi:hypothetical protein
MTYQPNGQAEDMFIQTNVRSQIIWLTFKNILDPESLL